MASISLPETDATEMLTTSCPKNEDDGTSNGNSLAIAPTCEAKTPERKQTRKRKKGRSLILTYTPEKSKLEKEAKESNNQEKKKLPLKKTTKNNRNTKT